AVERVNDHLPVPPAHEPRQRFWKIIARRAVLAAGALERSIAFGKNDRPGVMLACAARSYINRYAAAPGRRIAVFTNNDDGWRTAADAHTAGIEVAAVIDSRSEPPAQFAALGIKVLTSAQVSHVQGGQSVRAIEVIDAAGRVSKIECDTLATSGGWNPAVHLTCHLGGKPVWNGELAAFTPGAVPPGMHVAGAANGAPTLAECLHAGVAAGAMAAVECGFPIASMMVPSAQDEACGVAALWHVKESRAKAFVDFQNDVTVKDIALANQEGFSSVEHLKRYTTLGMATDQGKVANVTGLAILADASDRSITEVGTTTYRPPYVPVSFGAITGHHRAKDFRPVRLPPSHAWATEQGAVFVEAGAWLRAQYYPRAGERDWLETVNREGTATRPRVGGGEVSTLGQGRIEGCGRGRWRCLDLGQGRDRGRRCGDLPRSRLHQHILDAAGRQVALRPDAARGRLRDGRRHDFAACARALCHDHHHRPGRPRVAASRILPSGPVARTRRADGIGVGTVGAVFDR